MNPLEVVLTPPQRERLRQVLRLPDLSEVSLTGEGWHRFAVLTPDRVVLLPRSHRWVPGLDREASALALLQRHRIGAPRLLGRIDDDELWPYPVTIVTRYPGRSWAARQDAADRGQWLQMLSRLGELIAGFHRIDVNLVPASIGARTPPSPDPMEIELRHFEDYLEPGRLEKIAVALADSAELPQHRVDHWLRFVEPCLALEPTFTHRDINEGQIMINSAGDISGLIDWESAGVQHPLTDFDFGEWGFGIYAWESDFADFRRVLWQSYAAARGVALPDWLGVQLLMTIIGAPPPEGHTTAWNEQRRARTVANLRWVDARI